MNQGDVICDPPDAIIPPYPLRLAWQLETHSGYGQWAPESDRALLLTFVKRLNTEFGQGTHWLEGRATNTEDEK